MASNPEIREINEVPPDDLLVVFSRGRIVMWMAVAVLLHAVVIGATSVGYIRDHWIDPEGAKARQEAAAAQAAAEKAAAKAALMPKAAATNAPPAAAATNAPASTAEGAAATNGAAAGDDAAVLESRRNTAVVKRITETAASNEIPAKPDLGISLEDTAPR